ncbi:MAG: DUF3226 domain-containing protein [Candidatus Sulfotelmatobacter sp.]
MSVILPHQVKDIPRPFVVVCEGYGDVRLVATLLHHRGISNCNVGCPSTTGGSGSGKDGIGKYLKALQGAIQSGKANLQGILVVADADDDAVASFNLMVTALQDAAFPAPATAFAIEGAPLRTGIFLIPGPGRTGCLDHLLWEAAILHNPALPRCAADFFTCTGNHIAVAPPNNQAKMRMSAIVAAHCADNPWASGALIWSDPGNPVPVASVAFNDLSNFLVTFAS